MDTVLVMGYARSTKNVVRLLSEDYHVIVSDIVRHQDQLHNVEFILQDEIPQYLEDYCFVVKSPGIPYHNPIVAMLKNKQIPIYSEIEIAYKKAKQFNYIAITGTNGKTTTSNLIYHLVHTTYESLLAGNIGQALSDFVEDKSKLVVLELSNFQLLGIDTFKPHIATIMNLTPDHLDYMLDVESYYLSKTLIYKNQTPDDYFLLNIDDPNVVKYCQNIPSTVIRFSTHQKCDAYYEHGKIIYQDKVIAYLSEYSLVGEHNIQNAIVAVLSAHLMEVNQNVIQAQLKTFKAIKHRLQYIKTINGVKYYNDSKATNPEACEVALKAFDVHKKIILLAGGYDKKIAFDLLKQYDHKIKCVFAFGAVRNQFQAIFSLVYEVDTLEEATKKAYEIAENDDIVLLSPACASYDQFKSFEERGDLFIECVGKLGKYD